MESTLANHLFFGLVECSRLVFIYRPANRDTWFGSRIILDIILPLLPPRSHHIGLQLSHIINSWVFENA